MLMEQSLQTTQEQLSQRVTEVVRHEQVNRKLETELKTLRDRNLNSEEEIDEQKSVIDKLRKELMRVKEEHHAAVQEGLAYKQQAHKSEVELDGAKEQEKMLTEQVCTLKTFKAFVERLAQTVLTLLRPLLNLRHARFYLPKNLNSLHAG